MTFKIKANTPEAMRDEIVKWLKNMASNQRISASKARLVATRNEHTTAGNVYQNAAEFLEKAVIEK